MNAGDARLLQARAFAARHGWAQAAWRPLAPDGSFRRYFRLTIPGQAPVVLMDAPPPEDVGPFIRIARHLSGLGLSAPAIRAADAAGGFLLLEDLGDAGFATDPADPALLMAAAAEVLAIMQRAAPPPDLPAWDAAAMTQAALATLADWWWPARHGSAAPAAFRADLAAALTATLAPLGDDPRVFVHRDYFAGNLIWLPDRAGAARVGVLDFQSAALGHPAYDLASLTQDARRDTDPAVAARARAAYAAAGGPLHPARLDAAVAICAAQRHLRVAGLWVRLARRDGKPHYLAHGARTWGLLAAALRHPACRPLRAALDDWIPPADRANPPGLTA